MFYPAKFLTHLVSRLPDGGTDELHHEENVMISLRDDGTWGCATTIPRTADRRCSKARNITCLFRDRGTS